MTQRVLWLLVLAVMAQASPALADSSMAVIARKACMKASASALSALNPMHKGEKPFDAAAVPSAAGRVELACADWQQLWPEDSQSVPGFETRAAKAIWSDRAGFQRSTDEYFAALKALAGAKDEPSFKSSYVAFGQTCSACHQTFRSPE